jgi:hypothetical protein
VQVGDSTPNPVVKVDLLFGKIDALFGDFPSLLGVARQNAILGFACLTAPILRHCHMPSRELLSPELQAASERRTATQSIASYCPPF